MITKVKFFSGLFFLPFILLTFFSCNTEKLKVSYRFDNVGDRVWVGEDFWTVPIEDWQLKDGRIECGSKIQNATLSLLPYVLGEKHESFSFSVDMGLLEDSKIPGSSGISIGVEALEETDIRSAIFFGSGINLGVNTGGFAFLGQQTQKLSEDFDYSAFNIKVSGSYETGKLVLVMVLSGKDGNELANLSFEPNAEIRGIIQLRNNMIGGESKNNGPKFWFDNIALQGSKFENKPENSFGPVLWTMYTANANVLKLTAQMPPIGKSDNKSVDLQVKKGDKWETVSTATISDDARIAAFKVENWDMTAEANYRVSYQFMNSLGKEEISLYEGNIQKEPADRALRVGALTCQYHYGFPYSPLVKNLGLSKPDLLYFSGDQIYEQNGGYQIKREPEDTAILNYLGKWYMFGWAFGDLMRNIPTICTPDDHDVFQGNIWGEGGTNFMQTTKFINAVNATQCSHLPDPYDPAPIADNMSVWYTTMKYGRISFAIVSDRVFKADPQRVAFWEGRPDWIEKPLKDLSVLDKPGLELLGQDQEDFLKEWIRDWNNVDMKVLLSQTVFANIATHHGQFGYYLNGDMDSGGWPKMARDSAVSIIRKGFVFQIAGDQHLPSLTQYGIENYRDAGWCFVTPAIAVGYSRWFRPDELNIPMDNRPAHGLSNTGEFKDAFGNLNYVYAIGNPIDFKVISHRYQLAQDKSSGYAMAIFDPASRNITMESWRFLADVANPGPDSQHPGWPVTINQFDNYGRQAKAWLPTIKVTGDPNPVVEIINNKTGETEYIVRIKGNEFSPKVFSSDTFTIRVGYPEKEIWKLSGEVKVLSEKDKESITFAF